MRTWMLAVGVATGLIFGCAGPNGVNSTGGGANGQGGNGSGAGTSTGTGTGIGTDSGLPCDVADFLSAHCTSCHSNPPTTGVPMPLTSYAELTANKPGTTTSYAQLSLERIQAKTMPPGSTLTASDYAAFESWVNGGLAMGTCGEVDAGTPDPTFEGDPTCTGTVADHISSQAADGLPDSAKSRMNPGEACLACHQGEPPFNVAGTVFATGKVLDRCLPPTDVDLTQAKVIVTDKNGVDHTLSVNSVGNFHSPDFPAIAMPYTAKVTYMGKERVMGASQTNGDCNECHAETPTNGAPGRIALPQ